MDENRARGEIRGGLLSESDGAESLPRKRALSVGRLARIDTLRTPADAAESYRMGRFKFRLSPGKVKYEVQFQPGLMGMKLDPVIQSRHRNGGSGASGNGKELGCRVVKFVDVGSSGTSQARKSRKIMPGAMSWLRLTR